ncbi:hypothetical protein JD969_08520 [Planctomycetota bacterium]|nr:hypothetical protein JD969_08520 [Planctomycetota bacterium]
MIDFAIKESQGYWMYVVGCYVPTALLGLVLLVMWWRGVWRKAEVKCGGCGEVLNGMLPVEVKVCPGCEQAVSEKAGVVYQRRGLMRRGFLVYLSVLVLFLPLIFGFGGLYADWLWHEHYNVKTWSNERLTGSLLVNPNANGGKILSWMYVQSDDVWDEMMRRMKAGEYNEKDLEEFEAKYVQYVTFRTGTINQGINPNDAGREFLADLMREDVLSENAIEVVIKNWYRKPKLRALRFDAEKVKKGWQVDMPVQPGGWKVHTGGMNVHWYYRRAKVDGEMTGGEELKRFAWKQRMEIGFDELGVGEHKVEFELVGKFVMPGSDYGFVGDDMPDAADLRGVYYEMVEPMEVVVVVE